MLKVNPLSLGRFPIPGTGSRPLENRFHPPGQPGVTGEERGGQRVELRRKVLDDPLGLRDDVGVVEVEEGVRGEGGRLGVRDEVALENEVLK